MTDRELMQQALDALELVTDLTNHDDEVYAAIEALRSRLAQPDLITPADVKQLARIEKLVEDVDPYTAPPQREWQGLTEYEVGFLTVFDGLHDVEVPLLANFIRHIEAKLKAKNV